MVGMADSSRNAKLVAGMLVAIVVLPMIALAVTFPALAGPTVAVFLLTGVGVFLYRRRQR